MGLFTTEAFTSWGEVALSLMIVAIVILFYFGFFKLLCALLPDRTSDTKANKSEVTVSERIFSEALERAYTPISARIRVTMFISLALGLAIYGFRHFYNIDNLVPRIVDAYGGLYVAQPFFGLSPATLFFPFLILFLLHQLYKLSGVMLDTPPLHEKWKTPPKPVSRQARLYVFVTFVSILILGLVLPVLFPQY